MHERDAGQPTAVEVGESAVPTTRAWPTALLWYVGGVIVGGSALFIVLVKHASAAGVPPRLGAFLMLAALLVASEQYPISIQRRGGSDNVSLSGIFACALVLQWTTGWAVVAQVVAQLLDDVRSRRSWWKCLFNAGQYSLSLSAAAGVAHVAGYGRPGVPAGLQIVAALAAGFTFFLANNIITGTALAWASHERVVPFLLSDAAFQASVNGAMTVLAPVVIAAADTNIWMVPLLLVPAVAVYRGAHVSLEKEHRARHDHLTELPNRFYFTEAMAEAIRMEGNEGSLAVMVMDLDSFKELNDTLGHAAGDELLRQVGPRLRSALPADAMLARLGGDEFAVLLPDAADASAATRVAARIVEALTTPFTVEETSLDLHASIGIALFPEHGEMPEHLLQHADVAMYVAKGRRTGVEVYAEERNQHTHRRLAVLNQLRPALTRGELTLHYQPQVDMHTGMPRGVEALLRWHHPELGDVSPGEFIALAEHTGFIRQLSDFVLEKAMEQVEIWTAMGINVPIAVNLSSHVLREPESLRRILGVVRDGGLPEGSLVVELTESALMADGGQAARLLDDLAGAGMKLSIDDFGTGYSALSYLSRLPVSELKIDRSFVTHVDTHHANRHIVEAITALSANLGISVVAEGIERVAEWQTLAGMGCDVAQGFLISRAIPPADVTRLLMSGEPLVEMFAMNFGVDAGQLDQATTR